MLRLIRRMLDSKVGVWLAIGFVVLVGIAFAGADLSGTLSGLGTNVGSGDDAVITVGDREVGEPEFRDRIQTGYRAASQRQPGLTLQQFVEQGGFDGTVDRVLNAVGLEEFGLANGLSAGRKLVEGEIASERTFFGPSGRFDQVTYTRVLRENGLTEQELRDDVRNGVLTRQLLVPVALNSYAPPSIATAYARLSLESRTGQVVEVPSDRMPKGEPPTDSQIADFYGKNRARYTVPERRVFRSAGFGADSVAAKARPSEQDIAAAYRADQATYGARELRDITQVAFFDRAAAQAFARKVAGGQTFAAAAKAAGLEALTIRDQDRTAYARSNGDALVAAVYGAPQGKTIGPVAGQGSFTVARVDNVTDRPVRPLASVRGEIVERLTQERTQQLLSELDSRLYQRIDDGESLPDIARAEGLTLQTSAPLTAAGVDPDRPQAGPAFPPALAQRLSVLASGDDPVIEPAGEDGRFVVVDVERVVPAAARPLAAIRDRVAADLIQSRQQARAKQVADGIIAAMAKGRTLAQAMAAAGVSLPPPQTVSLKRQQLEAAEGAVAAPLRLLFAMAPGTAKRVSAPDKRGYGVVVLTKVMPGDPKQAAEAVARSGQQLAEVLGSEYEQQFARAARLSVGTSQDDAALGRLQGSLTGATPAR